MTAEKVLLLNHFHVTPSWCVNNFLFFDSEVEQKVAAGSEVIDKTSGKKVGTVTTALGYRGLGLLRLEEAFKDMSTLTIKGQEDIRVESIRPEWWPAEWFQDHRHVNEAG